jgi:hypothetical protein
MMPPASCAPPPPLQAQEAVVPSEEAMASSPAHLVQGLLPNVGHRAGFTPPPYAPPRQSAPPGDAAAPLPPLPAYLLPPWRLTAVAAAAAAAVAATATSSAPRPWASASTQTPPLR